MKAKGHIMTDIRLADAQVIWDYAGTQPKAQPVRVVDVRHGKDDRDYLASWGACNSDFNKADDAGRLLMLFQQFHWMALGHDINPRHIHDAFMVIPEYREAIPPQLLPPEYRRED
jgi:hypothetical protein